MDNLAPALLPAARPGTGTNKVMALNISGAHE